MHRNMASAAGCRHPASRWPCLANQGECTTLVTLAWSGGAAGSAHQEHGAISRHKRLPRPAVARSASACLTVLNRSQRLATLRRCASLPFAVGRGPFIVFAGKPAIYIGRSVQNRFCLLHKMKPVYSQNRLSNCLIRPRRKLCPDKFQSFLYQLGGKSKLCPRARGIARSAKVEG